MQDGRLDQETLSTMIGAGDVDTVLVVFPDLQGRLMGKRVTGHFFLDEVLAAGVEACTYLLAVDIDMDPAPRVPLRQLGTRATATSCSGPTSPPCALSAGSRRPRWCFATWQTRRPVSRSRCRPGGSSSARSSAPPPPGTR